MKTGRTAKQTLEFFSTACIHGVGSEKALILFLFMSPVGCASIENVSQLTVYVPERLRTKGSGFFVCFFVLFLVELLSLVGRL